MMMVMRMKCHYLKYAFVSWLSAVGNSFSSLPKVHIKYVHNDKTHGESPSSSTSLFITDLNLYEPYTNTNLTRKVNMYYFVEIKKVLLVGLLVILNLELAWIVRNV